VVRLVLDTCVLVAAIRSPNGASGSLVEAVKRRLKPLISIPLVLEYEAVMTRSEHLQASGLTSRQVVKIVKAFCTIGEPIHIAHRLRPQLQDPEDEFVLEAAFHGKANAILTFNRRDFEIPSRRFGIRVISPPIALERISEDENQ